MPSAASCPARSLQTSDVDEARSFIDPQYYPSVLDLVDPSQRLQARFDVVQVGPVTVGEVRFGAELNVSIREMGSYHVNIPHSGWLRWRQESIDSMVVTPGIAAVYQPTDAAHDRWSGDCSSLTVKIEPSALQAQLASMLDAPVTSPVRLGPRLSIAQGAGRTWARLVRLLATDAMQPIGLSCHPLARDRFIEALLGGLLLSTEHDYRDRLDRSERPPAAPRPICRAIDAIQAHPGSPFTLAGLATIAGVRQRTLQEGFRRHVGTSPMRYLREVRLARAHDDLRRGEPTTVAAVAYSWGFTHLGRFAALYRARYGVAPSQHLHSDVGSGPGPLGVPKQRA